MKKIRLESYFDNYHISDKQIIYTKPRQEREDAPVELGNCNINFNKTQLRSSRARTGCREHNALDEDHSTKTQPSKKKIALIPALLLSRLFIYLSNKHRFLHRRTPNNRCPLPLALLLPLRRSGLRTQFACWLSRWRTKTLSRWARRLGWRRNWSIINNLRNELLRLRLRRILWFDDEITFWGKLKRYGGKAIGFPGERRGRLGDYL